MATVHAALDETVLSVTGAPGDPRVASRLTDHEFECLAAGGGRVLAGTVEDGLLRSTDGGRTWTAVGFEDRVTAVTVGPDGRSWVGTEPSAVYRSTDQGFEQCGGLTDLPSADRWSFPPRPHTHHVRWLAVDPRDPDRLYVAIEAGALVRTTDGGETWLDHPPDGRRDTHTLAVHPDAPGRIYAAAGDGYAESRDGGETWQYPQEGLDHRYVWGLAVDAGDPDRVVVSAARGARSAHTPSRAEAYVYRRDGGEWTRAMDGLPDPGGTARAVLAAGGPGECYALTERGLFYTGDGAGTWRRLDVAWPDGAGIARGLAVVP